MLNLTRDPYKFRTESGEEFVVEPSGYVAEVEYEENCVGVQVFRREPYVGEWGHTDAALDEIDEIPIIEKVPKDIIFDGLISMDDGVVLVSEDLLLVTREVAEVAARGTSTCYQCRDKGEDAPHVWHNEKTLHPHPLAKNMVWATDWHATKEDTSISGTAYHALQKVPQS